MATIAAIAFWLFLVAFFWSSYGPVGGLVTLIGWPALIYLGVVRRRPPKRAGGPKHYDALHFSEVASALARIDGTNCAPSRKRAIRFTALTASRQVEVRRATWEQFDLEGAV